MKVLAGLITALVLALGLTVAPANAVVYPHSITTNCTASSAGGTKAHFRMSAGTAKPKATVFVRVINAKGNVVKSVQKWYPGGTVTWGFGPLRSGRYKLTFHTKTGVNSVYKNCSTATFIRAS